MKFTVNKREFNDALYRVVGVIPTKTTIPILGGILLDLTDNTLSLTGTDLEVSISTSMAVHGAENGGVAVPAKLLHEIVRELPEIPLEVESDENDRISIKTEKGLYRISGESKDDFPRIVVQEDGSGFNLDMDRLKRMINKTIFAVSSDELRTTLMGIFIQVLERELRFVTTDGHRLVKFVYTEFTSPDGEVREVIVPTKAFNLLLRNSDGADEVEIRLAENHIVFKLPQTIVYSKLIDGQFPNYERVIPTDNDKDLFINREQFHSSIRRVSLFSNSMTRQVRLSLESDMMNIQAEDLEFGGEARESLPTRYSQEAIEIGYNAMYVMDVLRHLDTEEVHFKLKDAVSAGIIYPTEQEPNEELMMLLMPIRLYED